MSIIFSVVEELKLRLERKPSEEAISYFVLELSMLLSSGLSLIKALEILHAQLEEERLKRASLEIKKALEEGKSVAQAFAVAGVFPEFLLEMLKTAERGESLEKVLIIAGEFLKASAEAKAKLLTTLAYPVFVLFSSLLAVILTTKLVVPKVASVLENLGKDLPLITKALLLFSIALGYLLYLLPLLILLYLFKDKLVGRERWDYYLLKIPVIGSISYYTQLSRFARSLWLALSSGIQVRKAISLAVGSVTNAYLRKALEGVEEEVAKGKRLSTALKERGVLPSTFVSLLQTGEASGELERSLELIAQLYQRQVEKKIGFWLRFAEPIAMLVVGGLVALIVLSVVLPLTEISTGVKR